MGDKELIAEALRTSGIEGAFIDLRGERSDACWRCRTGYDEAKRSMLDCKNEERGI